MNKSMLIGLFGGIGIATAGGVASYAWMSQSAQSDAGGSAVVEEAVIEAAPAIEAAAPAPAPAARPAAAAVAPAPAPRQVQAPAPRPAPAVAAPVSEPVAEVALPAAEPEMRCWEEEVTVEVDPKDDKAIAGTATGAILGGAIAKRLGDDNDLATAAGAAAGAFAGRRLQRRIQENNTETVIEQRCEPVQ